VSKQYFPHSQEKKNKMNPRRYRHLLKVIDDDYENELKEIKKEYESDQRSYKNG
jgi:hypothetical protein